jgi:3-oxoacyl-[acyl-carrier-protein] synthase III
MGPDMYCRVGGHRVHPLRCYEAGWHHLTQNFDKVATLAVDLAKKAGDRMSERIGLDWKDVKFFFMNVPTKHIHDLTVSDFRRDKKVDGMCFYSKVAQRGYPGPCAVVHALDGFLTESSPPGPGDLLASVVAESSKWIYAGFVLEYLGAP